MKKFLFPALALGLVMTSCQSDEPFAPGAGEEVQASFTISVPDAMGTRANEVNSAKGGFSNGAGNLNYTVALLNQDNKVMYSETCQSNDITATFHPTVVQGYTYKVVAYATFGNAVAESDINEAFDDNDALASIATLKGINDESEDAYYCFNTEVKGGATMDVTLRRPFGKLRLVATDYDKLKELGQDVKSVKVTYGENVVMETHFNAMAEAFGGEATSKEFEANKTTYSEDAANELTVFTDYLPASKTGETMYPFTIVTTYTNGETYTRTFSQDIPVKRNYLTTLRGDFFTTEAALTLTVNEMFTTPGVDRNIWDGVTTTIPTQTTTITDENGNQVEATVVSTAAELAGLAELVNNGTTPNPAPKTRAGEAINFVLTSDIDLGGYQWTPIGTEVNNFIGTFDGNGHTISNLKIEEKEAKEGKAYIGFFGYAKNATIKNVTFENVNLNIACLDIDHSQGHIGAVAGSLEGNSTIENVTVKGDIEVYATQDANGASRVAVVAGGNTYGNVTMKNVHVVANEGSYLTANNNTGALAGQLQGKMVFENCSSNIDVTVNKFFAGGLVGIAAGDSYIKDCHTTGDVAVVAGRAGRHNDEYRVGGIAGGWADGKTKVCTLEGCSYTGTVSGTNADGSVASPLDYMGYVGRGYTLANCAGSKVIIDGVEFVQKYDNVYGVYTINGLTPVSTADELVAALEANEGVYFLNDIKIDPANMSNAYGKTGINVKNGQTIDGNGYTLNIKGAGGTWDSGINTTGGLIKDLTVTGSFRGIFINHNSDHSETVVLENVTIGGNGTVYTISCDQGLYQGIEATNCTFNGWTSFAKTAGEAKFVNCSFGEGSGYKYCRPYSNTEFVDCTFCHGYEVDTTRATVTFTDCTWE